MFKKTFSGANYIFKGFRFLGANPKLWIWALLPTILNLLLLFAMITMFVHFYNDIYSWLTAFIGHLDIENPSSWYMHILDAILWFTDMLLQLLIILLSLIILLLFSYALGFIIAAPFNDILSEKVEIMVTGQGDLPFSFKRLLHEILRTLRVESIKALILIIIPIIMLVFNFIPVIGGLIYTGLTLFFGAFDIGFNYADLPMGRKVFPLKQRISFAKNNKWGLIGLGIGFIIPFFNLIFVAPMVVAGTLFYLDHKGNNNEKILNPKS